MSPGIGFGDGGDGHVRFALVENEQRIAPGDALDPQAAQRVGSRRRAPSEAEPTIAAYFAKTPCV